MSRLRTIIAAVVLVLWVPITSHCLLESMGAIPAFLHCTDECAPNGSNQGSDDDSCGSLESASYKIDEERPAVVSPVFAILLPALLQPVEQLVSAPHSLGFSTVASPELPVTWQFFFRTALPPRAPSFVS